MAHEWELVDGPGEAICSSCDREEAMLHSKQGRRAERVEVKQRIRPGELLGHHRNLQRHQCNLQRIIPRELLGHHCLLGLVQSKATEDLLGWFQVCP